MKGMLSRFNDFATGLVLFCAAVMVLLSAEGAVVVFGPVLAAAGCVFVVLSLSE